MSRIKFAFRRYPGAHLLVHDIRWLMHARYRRQHRVQLDQLAQFRTQSHGVLTTALGDGSKGTAVVLGWSRLEHVLEEAVIRKALDLAGFRVHVLTEPTPLAKAVYSAMGEPKIESFLRYCSLPTRGRARQLLVGVKSFAELIALEWDGVTVGKYVSSSLMRQTRKGSLDLDDETLRERVVDALAASMSYVDGAKRLIAQLAPKAVVLVDRGYSPFGEIFDVCVNCGIAVYTWNAAHRDNTIMLKRYHAGNRDAHPSSLSPESWAHLLETPWGEKQLEHLNRELAESYNSGEWYGEVGTQFGKRGWTGEEIVSRLGLDPGKKTAVVFAHIFWDATFFWGEDLFRDYEDWFVQTVRAACANDRLNWLIKVHPANLIKDRRDGISGEPSEILALRRHIGELPAHVRVIAADTDITTLSLFEVTDYCLTVRGTVGMEAALLGKNVLTAGTGRYDRHGFTTDFNSRDEYLARLSTLQELEPPTRQMRERAERYSYGVFLCRPVRLQCFSINFAKDADATLISGCAAKTAEELRSAPELVAIADWLTTGKEDFFYCMDVGPNCNVSPQTTRLHSVASREANCAQLIKDRQ